jgi:Spy/CpxP family protein refolding chaperone
MRFDGANRKAVGLLVLVFALGIALGAVGHMLSERSVLASRSRGPAAGPGSGPGSGQLVNRLTGDLNLSPDQQKQLKVILADTQSRYDAIRQQTAPQFDEARDQGRERMRQILTPDQVPKLDDFFRRVDEDRRKRGVR